MAAIVGVSLAVSLAVSLGGCGADDGLGPRSPFAIEVASVSFGDRAGFGQSDLPYIVLGPPRGGGLTQGSLDTLSLGVGGSIVVELGTTVIDGQGTDFIVFENAFQFGGTGIFAEPGFVSVSEDGEHFTEFPCEPESPERRGCAGVAPVFANADENDIDPTDPQAAGGDAFDLASIGVTRARFVRIVDAGISGGFGTDNAGFDLDAVAVVHGE
ncbi:MAG: cell surface protein [Deltaproteobacteria bacterium]|nr:cell surface protein [Deltaproteobacteria bacterium]